VADATIVLLLGILAVVGIVGLVLALRHRLAFRIAMRNVRRGRGRTVLLIVGLLVGTTIISGSLVVGSTVQTLNLHYTYLAFGYVDESIHANSPGGGFAYFPYSTYASIASAARGHPGIVGITPFIVDSAQVIDQTTGVPETNLNLVGTNANQSANLGSFVSTGGTSLAGPAPGQVLIDQQTATALDASAGDSIVLYGPHPVVTTIEAVVQENVRGAFLTAGLSPGDVFVDLATAQTVENASGLVNYIGITNAGSQQDGVGLSDGISAYLNTTLAGIPSASKLTVYEPLKDGVASANTSGTGIQTIFLVLGLFSVVAGAMLIVGIFLMLAEERKGEMGMLRAIGLRRSELVYTYFFEGLAYAAGSALAGTVVGVGAGYLLTYTFSILFASQGVTASAVLQSFTVTADDLVIAYVVGFLLTIITVAIASSRVSRLNIVRAIRDLPAPRPPLRLYTFLGYLGGVLVVVGGLLFAYTYQGATDLSEPIIGGVLVIFGLGLVASRFVKNRLAFSAVGIAELVWAGLGPLHTAVLGSAHTGGIFIVFVEGIAMVAGALLFYVFNSSIFVAAVLRVAGRGSRGAPVARIGLSYPGRQSARTAVTLTIFALVIFTMVAIACFGATVQANLNNTIQTQSGGYSFFGVSSLPMPNLPGQVANNSTLNSEFRVVVPLFAGAVVVNVSGSTPNPYTDRVYAAPDTSLSTASFYRTSQFSFSSTWNGMSSAAVLQQLATNRSVAIVDHTYAPVVASVSGGSSSPHPTLAVGAMIRLTPPGSSTPTSVRVIGIMEESIISGVWLNPTAAQAIGYTNETSYFLSVRSGVSTTLAAQDAKRAFFQEGLILFDIGALLQSSIATTEGFIGLLEIFVGLGLAVGVAAMGILALRAVVERRREIGMLRASGFSQRDVLKSFILEYSYVTVLGIGIGTWLGIWIVYQLSQSPSAAASGVSFFAVPYLNLALIIGAAYGLAMLAISVPSIRASRLPPAESVRATE
jgi:putative ABC transport system permease protein